MIFLTAIQMGFFLIRFSNQNNMFFVVVVIDVSCHLKNIFMISFTYYIAFVSKAKPRPPNKYVYILHPKSDFKPWQHAYISTCYLKMAFDGNYMGDKVIGSRWFQR